MPGGGGFRIYTVTAGYPAKSREDYRLKVTGLVDGPVSLTYDDLLALPQTQLTKDFQCVTGWRVEDVDWQGVKLADLLDHVGAKPGAKYLHFTSFDGAYTESLTMDQARRPDVLVANHMLGKPVTRGARWPGPALRGADVRLQVDQVARQHRGHQRPPTRLLGGLRLRRRRVGRQVERPRRRAGLMAAPRVQRFDPVERALHWVNAALLLALLFTGLAMYWSPMSQLIGRRRLMEDIHVSAVWRSRCRSSSCWSVRGAARSSVTPAGWVVSSTTTGAGCVAATGVAGALRIGKFNAGQKINAILVAG